MPDRVRRLPGRAATAAVVADLAPHADVYARLTMGEDLTGWLLDDVVAWAGTGPWGRDLYAIGPSEPCVALAGGLLAAGTVAPVSWAHLPRSAPATMTPHLTFTAQDDWEFRWTDVPPPPHPDESRVVPLADAELAAAHSLMRDTYPHTTTWPGDPRVSGWYGIWDGDRLVAVGGDRSRGGVGYLAGLAVATDRRGDGLGTALTTAMSRGLLTRHGVVGLSVMSDNTGAVRLYERLGFTSTLTRSSVELA
jgi:ribosomal protein S18 acetylase RimI-like enzyme